MPQPTHDNRNCLLQVRVQKTNSRAATAVLVRNCWTATGNPVIGLVTTVTNCCGRIWYSNEALILAWIRNCTPGVKRLRVVWNGTANGVEVLKARPLILSALEFTESQRMMAMIHGSAR